MSELITAGVELMLLGMGLVFLFLAVLVATVNLMSFVIRRYAPESMPNPDNKPSSTRHDEVIAAITTAIHLYRAKK